jgi:sulfite reductase beta subunit-like hemoprotein
MTDEHKPATEKRLTIVYCGGCNPHIDRTAVAGELPVDDPDVTPGATVHVSGCPRACASSHLLTMQQTSDEVRGAAATPEPHAGPRTVVVAGELVDGVPTRAADLALTVTRKLKE